MLGERSCEIVGHFEPLGRVEDLPVTVLLGLLNRGDPGLCHPACCGETGDPRLVGGRPWAGWLAGGEVQLAAVVVEPSGGTVHPPETQCLLDGLIIGKVDVSGLRAPGNQPAATGGGVVLLEPAAPCSGIVGMHQWGVFEF